MNHTRYANHLGGPTSAASVVEQSAHLNARGHALTEFIDPDPTGPIAVPQIGEQPRLREIAAGIANRTGNILSGMGLAGLGWLSLKAISHASKAETLREIDGMVKTDDQTWNSYIHLINEHTAVMNENLRLLPYPTTILLLGAASFAVSIFLRPDKPKLPTHTSAPKP